MEVIKEVIVIGAGQAGLSAAYYLNEKNLDFIIMEKGCNVASSWSSHYDSLQLITPQPFNNLPGKTFHSKNEFPYKHELISYLKEYAVAFSDRIIFNHHVISIDKSNSFFYVKAKYDDEIKSYYSNNVIIASGYNSKPYTPDISKKLSYHIHQIHASEYKNIGSIKKGKKVLVVGAGNSGVNIALELSKKFDTYLSCGNVTRLPRKIFNKDIFEITRKIGLFSIPGESFIGKKISRYMIPRADATYGLDINKISRKNSIRLLGRIVSCDGDKLIDSKNNSVYVDSIVWATGYRPDYSFVKFSIFDPMGLPKHKKGVTEIQGLYFIGLKWQSNMGSHIIYGAGRDAKYIIDFIKNRK